MARLYKDGNGTTYDPAAAKFTTTPFGMTLPAGKSAAADLVATPYYTPYDFSTTTVFAQKADNSVAGEMRDCGECHVGGGLMEYMIDPTKTTAAAYDPAKRTSLRDYVFGGAITAFNALIDIFNPDAAKRGDVVVQDYAQTGVLEMDCLMCHQSGYDWAGRKEAVRKGEFDASRALGARLATSAKDGVTVFYNSTSVVANATTGYLTVDLSTKLNAKPASEQCTSCHLGTSQEKYQVDWKKRGEMWTAVDANGAKVFTEVHASIGCMGCHERMDSSDTGIGTNGLAGTAATTKLGLCDPAKGSSSPFEALWNQVDGKQFKKCEGCHEPAAAPSYNTYGAPASRAAHDRAGLNAKVGYNADGSARASHLDLIDCTACHVRKSGFSGGAFVDGTGADEEGRLAVHDTETVAKADMADGTALSWSGGKLYSANLLTSFFWRDMNGLKTANGGLDANNDGREAGMDPLLPTHVNNINRAFGLKALSNYTSGINAARILTQQNALLSGIRGQLGNATTQATNPAILKLSFLMVPFKTSHNTAYAQKAWGAKGCKECHSPQGTVIAANDSDNRSGVAYTGGGFYNGAYPINGNLNGKFSFDSNQVTTYTKVNGLVDTTDSHPNVVTKKGDRSVPVNLLTLFDNPYAQTVTPGQTLRNIDRSEIIYETSFQTRDTTWYDASTGIQGGAIPAACVSTSPFYCETVPAITTSAKRVATSTIGWTLKVEVTADSGTTITTRTKMIGEDMLTTVDGIVTALGGAYADNPDFKVEAVDSTTGAAAVSPAVNNSLKLTPKGSNKIRISAMSDVGPFGLKGKLWKSDSIVRPSGSYPTRAAFVGYLNGITRESAGVGTLPVATIATVGGVAPSAGTPVPKARLSDPDITIITVTKGVSIPLAATTNDPTMTYTWASDAGVTINPGASSSVTFPKTGLRRLTLSVRAADGKIAKTTQRISVVEPTLITVLPADISSSTATDAKGVKTTTTSIPFTFTAVHDRVKISWGDGSRATSITDSGSTLTPTHVYNPLDRYKDGSVNHSYTTIIQLFNGTTLVSSKSIRVTVTP